MDDSFTTNQNTPLTIAARGVLLNDTDADGNSLTARLVAGPVAGTVSLAANGGFTYTPPASFSGAATFTYVANDGKADSTVATATITVVSTNHAPVATAQSVSATEDQARAITLAGTDSDGDLLTYTVATQPAHGVSAGSHRR